MSQQDVSDWLEDKRKHGAKWYSVKDIKEGLRKQGKSSGVLHGVHNDVFKLSAFNLIEFKGRGMWKHEKLFRARKVRKK